MSALILPRDWTRQQSRYTRDRLVCVKIAVGQSYVYQRLKREAARIIPGARYISKSAYKRAKRRGL